MLTLRLDLAFLMGNESSDTQIWYKWRVLEGKKSMKLVCQYMNIFCNFSSTLSHLYPLQVENCDSNSRLVWMKMTIVNSCFKGLGMVILTPARMPTTTANPIGIDAIKTFLLLASVDPAITRHSCKEMSISHRMPWSTDTPSVREMGDMLLRPASFINL